MSWWDRWFGSPEIASPSFGVARRGLLQVIGPVMLDLPGPIIIERGDSLQMRLTVTDLADRRVDITDAAIEVQVKQDVEGPDPPVISKAVTFGVNLLDQAGDTLGQADIDINSGDTDIAPRLYWLDVVTVEPSGRNHVIAPRHFVVRGVVNRP